MPKDSSLLYYFSAVLAIVSTVGYHTLVKKIPSDINPIISVIGIYVFVLLIALVLTPLFISKNEIIANIHKISWVQFGIAIVVMGMELGFLLMYRYGWDLSLGNVVTGIFINIALMGIGLLVLREKLGVVNILGIALCILGVAMIGWRPATAEASVTQESQAAPKPFQSATVALKEQLPSE
jgi:drug/metabolite transporter (DMT)-like permease